jgi:hypothetical protein
MRRDEPYRTFEIERTKERIEDLEGDRAQTDEGDPRNAKRQAG